MDYVSKIHIFHTRIFTRKIEYSRNGETENALGYICVSRRLRSSLNEVKVCRGADVGSDHHFLIGKMKLKLKNIPQGQTAKLFAFEKLKGPADSRRVPNYP